MRTFRSKVEELRNVELNMSMWSETGVQWRLSGMFFSGWYNQCLVFREAIICNDGVKQGVYFDNYGVTNKNFL